MLGGALLLGSASTLPAADWDWASRDVRHDQRDLRHDYTRVDRMRADIARDRARLDEDIRCGRSGAAAADARDLARDQRALDSQLRDIHRDRQDLRYDYGWR